MLVIMVVGESVRPDHLGVLGYPRDTTPWLTQNKTEWIFYSDVLSTANWTAQALPQLFLIPGPGAAGQSGLLQTFKEAGFQTAWISNQNAQPFVSADVMDIPDSAPLRFDSAMLPRADEFVRQGTQRQLLVLHMYGSHYDYDARYPPSDAKFRPTMTDLGIGADPSPRQRPGVLNSYDNTIVALDRFLQLLVERVGQTERPALLVYTSDHGENLLDDERGLFMHALPKISRHDLRVPLLIWANGAYQRRWPDKWAMLQAHSALPVSHVVLPPTLLDASGITWHGKDLTQVLSSPSFKVARRPLMDSSGHALASADAVR